MRALDEIVRAAEYSGAKNRLPGPYRKDFDELAWAYRANVHPSSDLYIHNLTPQERRSAKQYVNYVLADAVVDILPTVAEATNDPRAKLAAHALRTVYGVFGPAESRFQTRARPPTHRIPTGYTDTEQPVFGAGHKRKLRKHRQ